MHSLISTGQSCRLRWLSQMSRTTGHIDQTRYGEVTKTQAAKPDQGFHGAYSRILIFLLQEAGFTEGAPGPVKVQRCTDLLAQLDGFRKERRRSLVMRRAKLTPRIPKDCRAGRSATY